MFSDTGKQNKENDQGRDVYTRMNIVVLINPELKKTQTSSSGSGVFGVF